MVRSVEAPTRSSRSCRRSPPSSHAASSTRSRTCTSSRWGWSWRTEGPHLDGWHRQPHDRRILEEPGGIDPRQHRRGSDPRGDRLLVRVPPAHRRRRLPRNRRPYAGR